MKIFNIFNSNAYIIGLGIIIMNLRFIFSYFDFSINISSKQEFIVSFIIILVHYLLCIFLESKFDSTFLKILQIKFEKSISIISLFSIICAVFNFRLSCSFYAEYLNYKKFCPFSFSGLDYKLHLKRRCELFNINKESKYPFQYICSYNEEKIDIFSKKLSETFEIGNYSEHNCSKVKNLIKNNKVINEFVNEYYKEDLYYCDLKIKIEKFKTPKNPKRCEEITIHSNIFSLFYIWLLFLFIYWNNIYFRSIRANIQIEPSYEHLKFD